MHAGSKYFDKSERRDDAMFIALVGEWGLLAETADAASFKSVFSY